MKKLLIFTILLLNYFIVFSQKPYYIQPFEGVNNDAPELTVLNKDNSTADITEWTIMKTTSTSLVDGWGHSSFHCAAVNWHANGDDWLISPRMRVRKDYKFSFWAQAWDPNTPEKLNIIASKYKDSLNTEKYTIKLEDITVNSSENLDGYGTIYNGARGRWWLYEYDLEKIPGLTIGDTIFIAIRYNAPSGVAILLDELQYDSYCAGANAWGTTVNEDISGFGLWRTTMWFGLNTTSMNEIFGPDTDGMSGNIENDVYADSYVFLKDNVYGFGKASLFRGQLHHLGILGIHKVLYPPALPIRMSAWIDLNGNNQFEDNEMVANEKHTFLTGANYGRSTTAYFNVPKDAPLGTSRLRVRVNYDGQNKASACEDLGYGQIYDYEVEIMPELPKPADDLFNNSSKKPSKVENPNLYISRVNLADLDKSSQYFGYSEQITGGSVVWNGFNYCNYTWLTPANLTGGEQQTITLNASQNNCSLGAWIDFNGDGVYDENLVSAGGEKLGVKQTSDGSAQFTFTVPSFVKEGDTVVLRARVVNYNQGPSMTAIGPTPVPSNSETEDYRVVLHNAMPSCEAPVLTTYANKVANEFVICPRGGLMNVKLKVDAVGGNNCSGNWLYSWFNGSKYWDGTGFNLATPDWKSSYQDTITTLVKDSTTFTASVKCETDDNCSNSSSVRVIILKTSSAISAAIDNPANGVNHTMKVTWSKVNGASYILEFSTDKNSWDLLYEGNALSYIHSTSDYPNGPCYYRVKSLKGAVGCDDYTFMTVPKYTACDNPGILISNPTDNTVDINIQANGNPDYTYYSVYCTTNGKYLDTLGNFQDTPVFKVFASWNGAKALNLDANKEYCFYVTAKNIDGDERSLKDASKACATTITCAPTVKFLTSNQNRCEADTVSFKVIANSQTPVSYKWKCNDNYITDATNSVLLLSNLNKVNEGVYNCELTNDCGTKLTDNIFLYVNTKPVLNVAPVTVSRKVGDSFTLSISPSGTEPFTYKWYRNTILLEQQTTDKLEINPVSTSDEGVYYCEITNSCGTVKKEISTLIVGDPNTVILYGVFTYANNNQTAMTNTVAKIINSENSNEFSAISDANGKYIIKNIPLGTYNTDGSTTKKWGGVTPIDALLCNRNFISLYSFKDNLRRRAADVDKNNMITPIDALYINRRFIGSINKYPVSDWIFENTKLTLNTDTEHNFRAICAGDADGSYTPAAKKLISDINLITDSYLSYEKGKLIELPVRVSRDMELGALGLIFSKTNNNFEIVDIKTDIQSLIYNVTENELAIAWSALDNALVLQTGDILFNIIIKVKNNSNFTGDNLFTVNPASVMADIYAESFSGETLRLPSLNRSINVSLNDGFSVYNSPNPFNKQTNFNYVLPCEAQVSLKVYNILGELVSDLVGSTQQAGSYSILFDAANLPQGVYIYKFEAVNGDIRFSKINKMILTE
ncbi:MAG: immunoglobulin domain-containing protein [Bacteroidales bacterium]|nr:immunoglobulin domain-containing protein [Bacteroidales bacterium]